MDAVVLFWVVLCLFQWECSGDSGGRGSSCSWHGGRVSPLLKITHTWWWRWDGSPSKRLELHFTHTPHIFHTYTHYPFAPHTHTCHTTHFFPSLSHLTPHLMAKTFHSSHHKTIPIPPPPHSFTFLPHNQLSPSPATLPVTPPSPIMPALPQGRRKENEENG